MKGERSLADVAWRWGVKWYKLVGSTTLGQQVDEDWEHNDPGNFTEIRFPWNKPPTQVCLHDGVIVQAVVDTGLMAVQKVVGQPGINPRRGPRGSLNDRWPHTIQVETEFFCSPLKSAPKLRDIYPEFAEKYAHLFRNGSHWRISEAEFDKLAEAIRQAGRPYSSP